MFEMRENAVDMVRQKRAAHASLLPPRTAHEMVDNRLAAAGEELSERLLAVWLVEDLILLDYGPGQFAPLSAQLIAQTGEFLFRG
jgi:hypothetical protein